METFPRQETGRQLVTIDTSCQVSIDGLLQLMILEDGSVQINLAGKHVEVERNGLQYVVRHEAATQVLEPTKTLVSPAVKTAFLHHIPTRDEVVRYGVD